MASSYVSYTGDGVQTDWAVTFPYLDKAHVQVLVNNVSKAFTWVNSGLVRVSPAVANGSSIVVKRVTPDAPLITFNNTSNLTSDQLNKQALQALYRSVEAADRANQTLKSDTQPNLTVPNPVAHQSVRWKADLTGLENVAAPRMLDSAKTEITIANPVPGEFLKWGSNSAIESIAVVAPPGSYNIATQSENEAFTSNLVLTTPLGMGQFLRKRHIVDGTVDAYAVGVRGDNSTNNADTLAECFAELPSYKGTVRLPVGPILSSSAISLLNIRSVSLVGAAANEAADATSGTTLMYTGNSGSLLRFDGCQNIKLANMNISYNSPSYGGRLIDLSQALGGVLTSYVRIEDCRIGGADGCFGADALINVANTIDVRIAKSFLQNAAIGIRGPFGTDSCNTLTCDHVEFNTFFGSTPVYMGGNNWTFRSCNWEPPKGDGKAGGILTTDRGLIGLSIDNCGFQDAGSTDTNGVWLSAANGGPITGGSIGGGTLFQGGLFSIDLGESTDLGIAGCIFNLATVGIVDGCITSSTVTPPNSIKAFPNAIVGNRKLFYGALPANSLIDNKDGRGLRFTGKVNMDLASMPSSDPHVADELFRSGNNVMVSTG